MLIHRAVESDHARILPFVLADPLGWVDEPIYRRYLASGSYGVDRIWLAEESQRIRGCAIWYGSPSDDHPFILDCLWVDREVVDRADLGTALMQAASLPFEFHLFLKPHWRDDPMLYAEVEWRVVASRAAGLTGQLERLRFEWTAESGLPLPSERLTFFPEPDDDVFLNVFQQVAFGSLDHGTIESVARLGLEGHARETLACYRGMRGRREWWRTAFTQNGERVGFTIPSANEDSHVIGYLGVVPEMRGHGYAADLLAEATRVLAADGAQRIRADTDLANVPMGRTFERARYRHFGVRLVLS